MVPRAGLGIERHLADVLHALGVGLERVPLQRPAHVDVVGWLEGPGPLHQLQIAGDLLGVVAAERGGGQTREQRAAPRPRTRPRVRHRRPHLSLPFCCSPAGANLGFPTRDRGPRGTPRAGLPGIGPSRRAVHKSLGPWQCRRWGCVGPGEGATWLRLGDEGNGRAGPRRGDRTMSRRSALTRSSGSRWRRVAGGAEPPTRGRTSRSLARHGPQRRTADAGRRLDVPADGHRPQRHREGSGTIIASARRRDADPDSRACAL